MFRIEKNGIGPYRHVSIYPSQKLSIDLWMDKNHHEHQMPTACQDSILSQIFPLIESVSLQFPKDVLYAFNSLEEIYQYFSSQELKRLRLLGFEIRFYESHEYAQCLMGESQVVMFLTQESYDAYLKAIEDRAFHGYIPMF